MDKVNEETRNQTEGNQLGPGYLSTRYDVRAIRSEESGIDCALRLPPWQDNAGATSEPETDCNMACSGDPRYLCGAGNRLSYYNWIGPGMPIWNYPSGSAAGSYDFLIGGPVVPLMATQAINNKVENSFRFMFGRLKEQQSTNLSRSESRGSELAYGDQVECKESEHILDALPSVWRTRMAVGVREIRVRVYRAEFLPRQRDGPYEWDQRKQLQVS